MVLLCLKGTNGRRNNGTGKRTVETSGCTVEASTYSIAKCSAESATCNCTGRVDNRAGRGEQTNTNHGVILMILLTTSYSVTGPTGLNLASSWGAGDL